MKDWLESAITPDRVISLVAAGGTGKTALVDKALHESPPSDRAGLFVWSFYEDPHTDAFLRAAFTYFTGTADAPTGGMLERLQIALSGDVPHVLVLDGLERVQSEGDRGKRGELEDLQLKRFLRALAGGVGAARAVVTSRFPLVDLDPWTGAGHRAIPLDDLDLPVALAVLRAWNVKGDDAALAKAIEPLNIAGTYHALSVAVLGSYIGNFAGGDPACAFSLADAKEVDAKADKLWRILEQYAKALNQKERDLLARLSLFPRGVKVEILGWIVQFGGEVAGALVGLEDRKLRLLLERLRTLGLVFSYKTDSQVVCSAHPFLREFFRGLLATKPESVHESVRAKLEKVTPSLISSPQTFPADPALLDQYELLIEQTLLASRVQEAFDLYWNGLGNHRNLGWVLGENVRGLRMLERFFPRDDFSVVEPHQSIRFPSRLINDLGLYARNLGNLTRARAAFGHSAELNTVDSDSPNASVDNQNLADVALMAGCFPQALAHSERALLLASQPEADWRQRKQSLAYRATAHFVLGTVAASDNDLRRATELQGSLLDGLAGIAEAEAKFLRGHRSLALEQTRANLAYAVPYNYAVMLCRCNAFLARLLLPGDPAQAAQHVEEARAFATRSGDVDLQLRCFHAACELHRCLNDLPPSIAEAESGILLADTCGFGRFCIDLRLALAETLLAASDPRKALQHAREALDRSLHPDCQYAWGEADGLHFCGLAHLRLGERDLARHRLTAALELREKLTHGRVEETRQALASLGETAPSYR